MRTIRLALLALCLAAQPVRADLIIPSDFTVTDGWGFNRCLPASSATVCINGLAYYGQNTTTGLFGVTYDFWSNIYGTVPDGLILGVTMSRIVFRSVEDPGMLVWLGQGYSLVGPPLTSGQFYSPQLTANATIWETGAHFTSAMIVPGFPFPVNQGEAFVSVTVSPIPEPSTLGLVALGLFAIGFMRRRQRRTTTTDQTAEL